MNQIVKTQQAVSIHHVRRKNNIYNTYLLLMLIMTVTYLTTMTGPITTGLITIGPIMIGPITIVMVIWQLVQKLKII